MMRSWRLAQLAVSLVCSSGMIDITRGRSFRFVLCLQFGLGQGIGVDWRLENYESIRSISLASIKDNGLWLVVGGFGLLGPAPAVVWT
jgi:hypothetical protein